MVSEKRALRREENQRRQRREILAAALELFSARGYHNVSMNDIAREAEYAMGTIYKFFPCKEKLYQAIVSDVARQVSTAAGEALAAAGSEYERIVAYLQAGSRVFRANSQAIRLYFAETRGVSFNIRAGLDRETVARHEKLLASLAEVFAAGIDKGIFSPLDPTVLARALDSLALSFLFAWLDDAQRYPAETNLRLLTRIFFDGVLTETGRELREAEGQA